MAYFSSSRGSVHSLPPPFYNVTNTSLNMTPGYLVYEADQGPSGPSSVHRTTHRATVIAFMGVFVFITLTLTTAILLFCKKKNSVFLLQKSDLHADLDLELEEIPTDISDDFGSFTLEITDVNHSPSSCDQHSPSSCDQHSPSVSDQQDLDQLDVLLGKVNTMKHSKSLPMNFNACQQYTKLQHLPGEFETCEELLASSTHQPCQTDSIRMHQLNVSSSSCSGLLSTDTQCSGLLSADTEHSGLLSTDTECSGLLSADTEHSGLLSTDTQCSGLLLPRCEQTDTQTTEQLFIFPANRITTQEGSD
jgi:hypothetical protein